MEPSKRKVCTEAEILAVRCPICEAIPGRPCISHQRHALIVRLGQTEFSFHSARISTAQDIRWKEKFGVSLSQSEKTLILQYAFIMLCDSVSTKSIEVMGRQYTSDQIQAYFCNQAIKELQNDELVSRHVKPN